MTLTVNLFLGKKMNIRTKDIKTLLQNYDYHSRKLKENEFKYAVAHSLFIIISNNQERKFNYDANLTLFILSPDTFYYLERGDGKLTENQIVTTAGSKLKKIKKIAFKLQSDGDFQLSKVDDAQFKLISKINRRNFAKNFFIETIRNFYHTLPNRNHHRILSSEEYYQLMLYVLSVDSNDLMKEAIEFKVALYKKHHAANHLTGLPLVEMFEILHAYKLFDSEAVRFFADLTLDEIRDLKKIINFLVDKNALNHHFKKLYHHPQREKLQKFYFWIHFDNIITVELVNFILNYENIKELRSFAERYFSQWSKNTMEVFLRHPQCKLIVKLGMEYNLKNEDIFLKLLTINITDFQKILVKLSKVISVDYFIEELVYKKDHLGLLALLNQLPNSQIKKFSWLIIKQEDYNLLSKIIGFDSSHYLSLNINNNHVSSEYLQLLCYGLERLALKQQLTNQVAKIFYNKNEVPEVILKILCYILNFNEEKQKSGLILFEILKNYISPDDPIMIWIENHKNKTVFEKHEAILEFKSASENVVIGEAVKFPSLIQKEYPLIHTIYKRANILKRVDEFCYQIRKLGNEDTVKKHFHIYAKFLISLEEKRCLNFDLTVAEFFKASNIGEQVFKDKYKKLLQSSPDHYQLDFDKFFVKYKQELTFIYVNFNAQHVKILYKLLDTSVIKLVNVLDGFEDAFSLNKQPYSPLGQYILYRISQVEYNSGIIIQNILQIIQTLRKSIFVTSMFSKTNSNHDNFMEELFHFFETGSVTDKKLFEKLRLMLATIFAKELTIPLENILAKDCPYSFKQTCALNLAKENEQAEDYTDIFHELLNLYYTKKSLAIFLHDTNQNNSLGNKIAQNNVEIYQKLVYGGVKVALFMNYPLEQIFTVFGQKLVESNVRVIKLWQLLQNLNKSIVFFIKQHQVNDRFKPEIKLLDHIQKKISNYINQISKKLHGIDISKASTEVFNFIRNDANMALLAALTPLLNKLMTQHAKHFMVAIAQTNLPTDLKKLQKKLENLINLVAEGKSALASKTMTLQNSAWKPSKKFKIKIWDKSHPHTFFLGNQLGCCLATDGSQFRAIIQRIIDDAMAIVTVIDEEKNEAVAGMWLFVAKDTKTHDYYLVANFTEMRAAIARENTLLRDAIMVQLLKYTANFAKQVNLKFSMAGLDYGTLENWHFDLYSHSFEKIGSMTLGRGYSNYYLKSLAEDFFYEYDENKIDIIYPSAQKTITGIQEINTSLPTATHLNKHSIFNQKITTAHHVNQNDISSFKYNHKI